MQVYKIPLTNAPNQTFNCKIPVDGRNLSLKFQIAYNEVGCFWNMTLTDAATDKVLLTNVPLLPTSGQYANILAFYDYLNLGSAYVIRLTKDIKSLTADNLGEDYCLLWGDTP